MDFSITITTLLTATIVTILSFFLLLYSIRRLFLKVISSEQFYLVKFLIVLFSISLFLAIVSPMTQLHYLFYLVLVVFIVAMGVLTLGTRRILEQYLTGLFIAKVLDLHIGDYIELDNIRGYITALEDVYIVLRDPRREYVYIPYTVLLQTPFRRVKAPEGHEVRIRLFIPRRQELKRVRELVNEVAKEYGLERLSVDVEKIGVKGIVLVVRGLLRDPRQEDELKYAILDRVYTELGLR
ncbi:potassium transport membrane protein, conjectural [Pyrobaculum islandicum DSM 4184]|uniref:Potassium transport membrane protein, conjectural n=1 Tax=Pyrobaculum islandicum (strain DSM 4184 / JCM 9189 / GEO3) TaxID=384616 RepID=A1RSX7_PYRIL|nr:mechanosensitive ion channel domain-containing protein [Pyrobaculum islandicum]ABL88059.1 potassium transport membrane protein, conjectural [Pyrobaculum islandicum DSM 4184]